MSDALTRRELSPDAIAEVLSSLRDHVMVSAEELQSVHFPHSTALGVELMLRDLEDAGRAETHLGRWREVRP